MKQKTVKELRDEIAAKLTISELEKFQEMGELYMTLNSLVNREPGQIVVNPELRAQLERNGYSVTKENEAPKTGWAHVHINQNSMSAAAEVKVVGDLSRRIMAGMAGDKEYANASFDRRASAFCSRLQKELQKSFGKKAEILITIEKEA